MQIDLSKNYTFLKHIEKSLQKISLNSRTDTAGVNKCSEGEAITFVNIRETLRAQIT